MAKAKLIQCEIRWVEEMEGTTGKFWSYSERRAGKWNILATSGGDTKRTFVKYMTRWLHSRIGGSVCGFSLRITKKDGTYQDEITIPKSADPKRSKG